MTKTSDLLSIAKRMPEIARRLGAEWRVDDDKLASIVADLSEREAIKEAIDFAAGAKHGADEATLRCDRTIAELEDALLHIRRIARDPAKHGFFDRDELLAAIERIADAALCKAF